MTTNKPKPDPIYIVVTEQDKGEFIQRVQERLSQNFECLGGPFITFFTLGQGNIFNPTSDSYIWQEYNQAMILGRRVSK